jgi:predicted DNA-binding transcriptional regulator YafY
MKEKNNQTNLLKIERHRTILNLLSDKKSTTLTELENHLNCSRITIQRDLINDFKPIEFENRKDKIEAHRSYKKQ